MRHTICHEISSFVRVKSSVLAIYFYNGTIAIIKSEQVKLDWDIFILLNYHSSQ